MSDRSIACSDCGTALSDDQRPCPECGSTRKTIAVSLTPGSIQFTGGELQVSVIQPWDGNSLTLAGVIYGVLVTAAAVAIRPTGVWAVAFAVGTVGLLALGLAFPHPIIGWTKRIIERASRPRRIS